MAHLVHYIYIVSAALFILSLKWMNSPVTARRGVFAGETGMLLAIAGTLVSQHVFNWEWVFAAFLIGTAIGIPIAYIMPMTAVPQRTALSHACGALAAALVGTAEYYRETPARVHHGGAGHRDSAGLSHFHRQPDGHGQAAGGAAPAAASPTATRIW